MYISKRSGMDHTVLPAKTPCLPFGKLLDINYMWKNFRRTLHTTQVLLRACTIYSCDLGCLVYIAAELDRSTERISVSL